jgi:hypothetical protein
VPRRAILVNQSGGIGTSVGVTLLYATRNEKIKESGWAWPGGRPGPVRRSLRSAAAALKVLNHSRFNNRSRPHQQLPQQQNQQPQHVVKQPRATFHEVYTDKRTPSDKQHRIFSNKSNLLSTIYNNPILYKVPNK